MKIFVVDDDREWQQTIEDSLIGHNVEIEFADDATSAIKRLSKDDAKFDKIICDGLSGEWELVQKAVQERGLSMLLWTANDDFLNIATERGIPNLHKGASSRELHNALFPPLGSVEAK